MTDVAWLLEQIADDEQVAHRIKHHEDSSEAYSCPATRSEPLGDLKYGEAACWCGRAEKVRRALTECDTKRRLVEACTETLSREDSHDYQLNGGTDEAYELARFTLRMLATGYAERPGYREG